MNLVVDLTGHIGLFPGAVQLLALFQAVANPVVERAQFKRYIFVRAHLRSPHRCKSDSSTKPSVTEQDKAATCSSQNQSAH
jgi:hypothetical protein